ncbi:MULTISPECIES: PepSY domain-containing protein [unclassified Bacillus (in: firmicutes)]|uniref:PepSY domain-containing protein n=1 Tax=unclassified Bacillus (in: firmicutes) TaxID=185979 RepID=UPI0008F0ECE3|nr:MULTISPECIES: PepSY domain-containing protein [unclassified Bacillus (in: firmicutes)]SFB17907.1 Predicted small secreted protein [Bacillus sp. UNCCL13]SFQ76524.1 Predicted small secreted protein [Bacillus sp. cl95]
MKWKSFLIGVAVGVAGGYAVKELASNKMPISPEKALNDAKNWFKQQGPINGSWIHMEPEQYEKNKLKYKVYKGGITKSEEGNNVQYEFVADAMTGTIIDVYQLT